MSITFQFPSPLKKWSLIGKGFQYKWVCPEHYISKACMLYICMCINRDMWIFVKVQTNSVSCTAKLHKIQLKIAQTFLAQWCTYRVSYTYIFFPPRSLWRWGSFGAPKRPCQILTSAELGKCHPLDDCPSLTTARVRWAFTDGCSQKFLCNEEFGKTLAAKY